MSYVYEKHFPVKVKFMPWLMCKYCGLVFLKNNLTKWCIKMGCAHEDHPAFKKMLRGA